MVANGANEIKPQPVCWYQNILSVNKFTTAASSPTGSFADMVAFMREERQLMEAKMDVQRQESEKLRTQVFEAKLQAAEKEAAEKEAKTQLRIEREKLRAEQLSTLHARLEALHDAKLLGHEELHAVEDAIADAIDAEDGDDRVVSKIITLSSRVSSDRAFARQVQRRKWA